MTLISVAILNGVLGMLSPEGDLKKYIKLLGSLCLVCAVASPVFNAIRSDDGGLDGLFPDMGEHESNYEELFGEALAKGAEEALERSLKDKAVKDLDLDGGDIDIDVVLERNDGGYRVDAVTAYIHSGGIFADPREINNIVNQMCDCSCTIIYD